MAAEVVGIRVDSEADTYLDWDLYLEQQTWDEEDWEAYYEQEAIDQAEREYAWENATDEQKREGEFYVGMHKSTCAETFALMKELPPGFCVTWYVAHNWPRYVLWEQGQPIAGFRSENKGKIVKYAHASPDVRKTMGNDFQQPKAVAA